MCHFFASKLSFQSQSMIGQQQRASFSKPLRRNNVFVLAIILELTQILSSHRVLGFLDVKDVPYESYYFDADEKNNFGLSDNLSVVQTSMKTNVVQLFAKMEFVDPQLQYVKESKLQSLSTLPTVGSSAASENSGGWNGDNVNVQADNSTYDGGIIAGRFSLLEDSDGEIKETNRSQTDNIQIDSRSGKIASIVLSTPILPGKARGNNFLWNVGIETMDENNGTIIQKTEEIYLDEETIYFNQPNESGHYGKPKSNEEWEQLASYSIEGWVTENKNLLRIDPSELFSSAITNSNVSTFEDSANIDPENRTKPTINIAVHSDGELIQMYIPRYYRSIPVTRSHATASIRDGNLVHFGLEQWGDIDGTTFEERPSISVQDAFDALMNYVGQNVDDESILDVKKFEEMNFWCESELQILPIVSTDPGSERESENDKTVAVNETVGGEATDEARVEGSNDFFMNTDNFRRQRQRRRGLGSSLTSEYSNITISNESSSISSSGTSFGQGYSHRLIYRICPKFTTNPAEKIEALVDAHNAKIYSFKNKIDLLEIKGSVFPTSNDGLLPDGVIMHKWPMPYMTVTDALGRKFTTDHGGSAPLVGDESVTVSFDGPYVRMIDACGVSELKGSWDLDWGTSIGSDCSQTVTGGQGNTHSSRSGFYELNMIKAMARSHLPNNEWLKQTLVANMNLHSSCNAFWDGESVNFYRGSAQCRNTGEISAVFDHEWGHGLDDNDVTPGISEPSGEGIADIYAAIRLNDSCVGRGFWKGRKCDAAGDACLECTGVRDIDYRKMQSNKPHTLSWAIANCNNSVHCLGLVYSEAIWSLYTQKLPQIYGYDANTSLEIVTRLTYIAAGHVSTWYSYDPPFGGCNGGSGYLKYLIADDDDGNLSNGTPHMKAIYEAFNDFEIACESPSVMDSGCLTTPNIAPVVSAYPGFGSVRLTWKVISGASSYEIFRTEGPKGCDSGKIKLTETTATFYKDEGLQAGREYFYIVIPKGASSSCFGPSSQCTVAVPIELPEVKMSCLTEKIILDLRKTMPQASIVCSFEAIGGFEGTVNLSCTSKTEEADCKLDQTIVSFLPGNSQENVTFVAQATSNASEGKSELVIRLSYGSVVKTQTIPMEVVALGEQRVAQYDVGYMAPRCNPGRSCSSGDLLKGRGSQMGPEQNFPNTIQQSCQDGALGQIGNDESIEKILVRSGDVTEPAGGYLKEGAVATIEATVHAFGTGANDYADFYYTDDASNPNWIWIQTIQPPRGGLVTLKASYTLPPHRRINEMNHAVRVNYRYKGSRSPCSGSSYDEADDLVFPVLRKTETTTTTTTSPPTQIGSNKQTAVFDGTVGAPSCKAIGTACDTGFLLNGRGRTGPNGRELNFPNTLDGCKDGNRGKYHKHGSIDRIVVKSENDAGFTVGGQISIEATVFTRKRDSYYADFYYSPDATAVNWIFIGEVYASGSNGSKVLTMNSNLFLSGSLQAIRVNLRQGDAAGKSPCSGGNRDDVDDIVFAVQT